MSIITTESNITAPTQVLDVGLQRYAYRRFGVGPGRPLLCLQHFTGTLDNWDAGCFSDRIPLAVSAFHGDRMDVS
jgi:hypothetical protein